MSYAMIHLIVAQNILKSTKRIKNEEAFMLGAVAPDSVHYRNDYHKGMKFNSHLCVGDEEWGSITNNDEWQENVSEFMTTMTSREDVDFLYGYCVHILTDIHNNINVWMPFKERILNDDTPGIGKKYQIESNAIDLVLYQQEGTEDIWRLLRNALAQNVGNLVHEAEVESLKTDILTNRFANRIADDVLKHRYVTVVETGDFIETATQFVKDVLFEGEQI